jgi:hypothetical protein
MSQTIEAALKEHNKMVQEMTNLRLDLKLAQEREAILKGKIEQLDAQLTAITDRSDHNLRWACEVTKQLYNIDMFIQDALMIAKQEFAKSDGKVTQASIDAIEKAITHEPLQPENKDQWPLHDNKVHR